MTHILNLVIVNLRINETDIVIDIIIETKYSIFNSKQYYIFQKNIMAGLL